MNDGLHLPGFEPAIAEVTKDSPRTATRHARGPRNAPEPAGADPVGVDPARAGVVERTNDDARVPFRVDVLRSTRRRRSVGASLHAGVLRVTIPSWMSTAEESHWVERMTHRYVRSLSTERIDLTVRATTLARRYDLNRAREIRWVDDMTTRWGSCTPSSQTIRISSRLAAFPDWVLDYVIVHELAHLEVAGHDERFWQVVRRYPRAERAIGYLIAKSGEGDELPEPDDRV